MKDNYQKALELIGVSEGGYSDHPHDNGGKTMYGVTQGTYNAYRKRIGKPTQAVNKITPAEKDDIFKLQYANPIRFDDLPIGLDYALLDFAVNSGVSRAVKYLQRIVGTKQDGILGEITLSAVKAQSSTDIIKKLCSARLAFLKRLTDWKHFGKGWTNRIKYVRSNALNMASDGIVIVQSEPKKDKGNAKSSDKMKLSSLLATSKRVWGAIAGSVGVIVSIYPELKTLSDTGASVTGDETAGAVITLVAFGWIVITKILDARQK